MKNILIPVLLLVASAGLCAPAPSAFYRDWKNDPVQSRQHASHGQYESWQIYYNASVVSTMRFAGGEQPSHYDLMYYFREMPRTTFRPSLSEMFRPSIPHSSYFCRMEQFTSLNYGVMLSLHAGGFTEACELPSSSY